MRSVLSRASRSVQKARRGFQFVMVSAVLGRRVSAQLLWEVAELGVRAGIEALKEALKSGMLREEGAGGTGAGRPGGYGFSRELMRKVIYTELGQARWQVLHQGALARLQLNGAKIFELASQLVSA